MENKSSNKFFMILSGVLLLVSGFLGYKLSNQKTITETVIVEKEQIQTDYNSVKESYNEVKQMYDELQTNNKQLQSELDAKREEIEDLGAKMEKYKNDAGMIKKLQRELTTIRDLIKSYLHDIDSLNTANQGLKDENLKVNETLKVEQTKSEQLTKEKNSLFDVASKLKAYQLFADALNVKSETKEITTTKASRADKIRACFTLSENRVTPKGTKTVYLKITSPSGHLITNGTEDVTGTVNGQKQSFSSKKEVDYNGNAQEVCLSFSKTKTEFEKGIYKIEVYTEGYSIGDAQTELK